jgi:hypothetical protein
MQARLRLNAREPNGSARVLWHAGIDNRAHCFTVSFARKTVIVLCATVYKPLPVRERLSQSTHTPQFHKTDKRLMQ